MANKQINELTEKSDILVDDDLIVVYDSEEAGSEKTKKVTIGNFVSVIQSNIDLYVAATGSDITGNGSLGSPWATPNAAFDYLKNKFINMDATITINVADGTYNMTTSINYTLVGQNIQIIGNSSTPSSVVFNFATNLNGISITRPGYLFINGIKVTGFSRPEYKNGFYASSNGYLNMINCIADGFGVGIQGQFGGFIAATDCIGNNCEYGTAVYAAGKVYFNGGTLSNNTYGAVAYNSGHLTTISSTYSGNTSGNTYTTGGGVIDVI